jgi:hypothetical protein
MDTLSVVIVFETRELPLEIASRPERHEIEELPPYRPNQSLDKRRPAIVLALVECLYFICHQAFKCRVGISAKCSWSAIAFIRVSLNRSYRIGGDSQYANEPANDAAPRIEPLN